ncbi:diphthamide biosynthesis protein [Dentipellis sp. KUC8613]|nr:diphthamide biosynthesis protein [Dentipellis sp. KUC8613]
MAENTAFASSGEDAIARPISLDEEEVQSTTNLSPKEFLEHYEIDRTAEAIRSSGFKRIALQFPDELLHDAVPIFRRLRERLMEGQELYVLADTSYGSCCADEVAAQHAEADSIIHYGHACMSKTYRLPVIYVFGKKSIDLADCVERLVAALKSSSSDLPKAVVLRHDVAYTHQADTIVARLRDALAADGVSVSYTLIPNRLDPTSPTPPNEKPTTTADSNSDTFTSLTTTDDHPILYVGPPSLHLTNLLMTHSSTPVYRYDPAARSAEPDSACTNRMLMRRYAVVQQARDADVFGILVGTLGVASYLPLITHLRTLLAKAHKKSYTISVGKLNPAKLANFMEIECFVLVACPENSLIDAKDFYRPIVTPFELQIALRPEPVWTGEYVLDFDKLLARGAGLDSNANGSGNGNEDADEDEDEDPDRPMFSLVTGTYRHAKRYGDPEDSTAAAVNGSMDVVLRNQDGTVATLKDSAAGAFLQSRTFRGLETRLGMDEPGVLEQGRSGIARGYTDDHRGGG